MWARAVEIGLGGWLLVSPWVFDRPADRWWASASDLVCGALIIGLAVASLWPRFRRAHLLSVVVGMWLILSAWTTSSYPAPPAVQHDILVGLTLLLFAIIPTKASVPPADWRPYLREPGPGH